MFNFLNRRITNYEETAMAKLNEIFKFEWEKTIKNLIKSTPKGQIRFTLIDFEKLNKKISRKVKSKNLEDLLIKYFERTYYSPNIVFTSIFDDFPPYEKEANTMNISIKYGSTPKYRMLLVFYANEPESNPSCADDLITYWFEEYVLPNFKEFKRMPVSSDAPLLAHPFVKMYSYMPISLALHHFGYRLTLPQYKEIFSVLGDKHRRFLSIETPDMLFVK